MCTILDAAEERGVNRGETLKLIMMVQKKIKKGDWEYPKVCVNLQTDVR